MRYFLSVFIIFFSCVQLQARVMKLAQVQVQPSNWWTNMQWDTVSFLVHSPSGIKEITANSSKNKIIATEKINKTYAIVKVLVKKQDNIIVSGLDLNGMSFRSTIPILENKNEYQPKGFSQADLIYLIMPDRFSNGDTKNDSVPGMEQMNRAHVGGRHGGDLQGIINHLDYIKGLGVTSIWLTPFQEMNDSAYSYHGYGISNLYQTDPRYGIGRTGMNAGAANNGLFKKYSDEVHQAGMKVIMDVVPNHIGIAHPWMHPLSSLQEWIHDSSVICKFEMTSLNDPYVTPKDKNNMEKGWFVKSMPDLNHQNVDLCNYLIQCHIWWIKSMNIDGLRIDTQPFNDKDFISRWAKAISDEFPQISIVGENWCIVNNVLYPSYYQASTTNKDGYNSHVPHVMDFPFFENLILSLNNNDMKTLHRTIGQDFMYPDATKNFIFLGNHDTERFYTSIKENFKKFQQAIVINATMRGIPQLYYGDEILMTGVKGINDGIMRKDMPGGWIGRANASNFFDCV